MQIVAGHDEALARWAAAKIVHVGPTGSFGPCAALGVATEERRLLAVWVFHEFVYGTLQISVAAVSPKWASRAMVHRLIAYPFEQLNVRKIWTVTPHTSDRVIRFNERLGMKREAVLRHQFADGVHAVFCGMTAHEYLKRYGVLNQMREAA